MSRSRSRRYKSVRPEGEYSARPPNPEQKGWTKIVSLGCQGTRDYWGEFDCPYVWPCEECPVYLDAEKTREDEFVGPPEPGFVQLLG